MNKYILKIINKLFKKQKYAFKFEIIDLTSGNIIHSKVSESDMIAFTDYEKRKQFIFKKYI